MHTAITILLICTIVLALSTSVAAFGAGDVPDFAYLNEKAFRHGDIESILTNLAKNVGGAATGGGLMSIAASVLSAASGSGGAKFTKMDVKRVYFGNWLRDYSQAMDIAGLSKLTAQTLVTVVSVLGFMTFGFATAEFEVTAERLGVYLPIEHIDNPKGYAEKEGDARQFHPKLRGPVDPRELEVNPRNGMKNYIATEGQSWDTSSAHVRRTLQQCIAHGRRARGEENGDQWEAFRLLGTALHTLEDLLAHSNWCEIALRKLGHKEVFCHVGDEVVINTPHGPAPPLVTGTFGSADFMHSVLGEGMDHLSEASVTNLTGKMDDAKNQGDGPISTLKSLFSKLPSGDSSGEQKMEQAEDIKNKAYDFNPDDVAPEEVQRQMWLVLEWRDGVYRDVLKKIEMVPGLSELIDELTDALNAYVFTVLEPVLKPMLQQATGVLQDGSKAVIDTDDQFEVFNNPRASDPSHSILAKDHFGVILNEPAGKIAQVVVEHSVNLIVKAWYDEREDPNRVIDKILEAFHHPYFANGQSEVQRKMADQLERWFGGLGSEDGRKTLQALTKESVRAGKNKRLGSDDEAQSGVVQGGHGAQKAGGAYGAAYEDAEPNYSYGRAQKHESQYGGEKQHGNKSSSGGRTSEGHGQYKPTYDRFDGQQKVEQTSRPSQAAYGQQPGGHHHTETGAYASGGRHRSEDQYAKTDEFGESRRVEPVVHSGRTGYGEDTTTRTSYGQTQDYGRTQSHSQAQGYGESQQSQAYGQTESGYGSRTSYGQTQDEEGGGRHHGKHHQHAETRDTEHGGKPSSYGQSENYGQSTRATGTYGKPHHLSEYESSAGREDTSYGGESQAYQASAGRGAAYGGQAQSYGTSEGRGGGSYGNQASGGRGGSYGSEGQSYGTSEGRGGGSYGSQVSGGRGGSYGSETQSYGASSGRSGSYGSEAPSYGSGTQSYRGGTQSYGSETQSYGGGAQSYGGDTQSYGGASQGRDYGRSEDTSYSSTGTYSRGDGYEGGASAGYGRQAESETGYGRQAAADTGYGREGQYGQDQSSETFGAERLSLGVNQSSRGQDSAGYGRGLRRDERDYYQQ